MMKQKLENVVKFCVSTWFIFTGLVKYYDVSITVVCNKYSSDQQE